ncbi:MAG: hypothetical protein Q9169_000834 [Polycauliona sp. 2 TL-2023]
MPASNQTHYPYANSTPMAATGSQGSSGSSGSNYSQYSHSASPQAYSPTEAHGYGSNQPSYFYPNYGYQQSHPTSQQPQYSTGTSNKHAKPGSSSPTTSKPAPYVCVYPGCSRAFARPYDLQRHMKVHFPDSVDKLDCPHGAKEGSFCKRVGENGFTRKDHLDEHKRKVHLMPLPKSARGTRN